MKELDVNQESSRRFDPASFREVTTLFERHIGQGDVAGAVLAVAVGDEDPCFISVGETGFGTGRAVQPDSLHRIYSQTKPITGIATMMLVEEGVIGLDQPIGELLPELAKLDVLVSEEGDAVRPAKRQPVVRDLLTHSAGFSYGLQFSPLAARYRELGLLPGDRISAHRDGGEDPHDLAHMVELLGTLPLARDPGEMFEYSLSIDVLGALIERVSGRGLDAFFQERIFGPLGMVDTSFVVPSDKLDRLVNLHERGEDGTWRLVDGPADSAYARPALLSGGGGLVSTAQDYARFTAMLANEGEYRGKRLLKPETARLARSNLLPTGINAQFYGNVMQDVVFGAAMQVNLSASRTPPGLYGWGGAAGTGMWVDPIHRLHVVLMTQYFPPEINLTFREDPVAAVYADLGLWPAGPRAILHHDLDC
ncbi:beta-lactamase family protein [Sphingomonadales bacterium 56]|nr:beta-lactamase family protein [Sphingomonadales bacterium 56]MBY2960300.1 beta-lactamase family protein [Sphingomonadales bacterium 58]